MYVYIAHVARRIVCSMYLVFLGMSTPCLSSSRDESSFAGSTEGSGGRRRGKRPARRYGPQAIPTTAIPSKSAGSTAQDLCSFRGDEAATAAGLRLETQDARCDAECRRLPVIVGSERGRELRVVVRRAANNAILRFNERAATHCSFTR